MKRIAVLGAGRVGRVIAQDLADRYDVTALDCRAGALERAFPRGKVRTAALDLADRDELSHAIQPHDLVVDALPGHLGRNTLKTLIEAGKSVVDIAFFPEDPFELDALARDRGVTVIVDMGLAPGMSNVLLGHHVGSLSRVDRFECLVGGLPVERTWPFEYKAPFSPADVLEEYTRPARLRRNGTEVVLPALSEVELVDFPGIGTLEAFNTDGLRSLLRSYDDVPNLCEKTLRYPGHAAQMRILRDCGFFDDSPLELGDARVRPRDLTSQLLFEHWRLEEDDPEFTVMRVTVEGCEPNKDSVVHVWRLEDRRDPSTGYSSMARTTGFACTAAVGLLLEGEFRRPGVHPPERLGEDPKLFEVLLAYQADRGIEYLHEIAGSIAS
jgi:lysine 6-dehydrogenase